ncbi:FAD binding domain-containing protein [Colletotrichum tofieldiae]|nr:FAD binding domain-containing protein [Colletotrichum tofieldiae]GKT80530.1 FAD binding domain-containing protein [Colletotrichum tofieldiae]GKT94888.1 FAD binding domain-containing protein [Colletotrichum tofieldiae]
MLLTAVLPVILLAGSVSANSSSFGRRELLLTDNVKCACTQLRSSFSNSTLFPNSTNYETQRINVWDKRANLHPACIYLPSTADELAEAYPGSNTIDDGVLVALNGLSNIKVNVNDNNVEVGPGNKWVDVYQALGPHGKYTIGGRLKTIGVPGLTLIGGVSYFLNKYGFTMDNTISYDVILGNGTQVVANATSNSDLFWALKGGGSNYGIVTKFVLKTIDMPQATSTYQIFNESAVSAFIKAACDMASYEDASEGAGAVININYNLTTKEAVPQVFGLQETTLSPPSHFANFTAIPAVSRSHNVTTPLYWHSLMDSPNQMFR